MPIRVFFGDIRPTDPEAAAAFTTYRRYLENLGVFLGGYYGLGHDLPSGIRQTVDGLPPIKRIRLRRLRPEQSQDLERHLRQAWHREGRVQALREHPVEDLPDLLPGTATDAYYAMFHAALAFHVASGAGRPRNHAALLRSLVDCIQRGLFPPPWSLTCVGVPAYKPDRFPGLPDGADITLPHNWEAPDPETNWGALCRLLKTTREKDVDRLAADWKEKNRRRRLPNGERERIAEGLRPTTTFDFLWRLRTRTDYRDVDAFLEGIALPSEARSFLDALLVTLEGTMAVFEALVCHYSGDLVVGECAERFVAHRPSFGTAVRERLLL